MQNQQLADAIKQHERLMRKLPPEGLDLEAVYNRVLAKEMRRHRSVKLVKELTGQEPDDPHEFLSYFDFPHAEALSWDTGRNSSERAADESSSAMGGHVRAAKISGESGIATFVFLKPFDGVTGRDKAGMMIAIMLHEMGHVDDIEKNKHLRFGERVDLVAAEEYAHRYACRRMMKENLRISLGFLLRLLLSDVKDEPDGSAAQIAARRIVDSGEFRSCMQFVGSLEDFEV